MSVVIGGCNMSTQNIEESIYIMQRETQEAFDDDKHLRLSNRDRDLVLDLINNPPAPNKKLINLVRNSSKYFIE